jgi:DNA repair ATPase RecN
VTAMAASDKDILARLADAGEDALRRLGEAPGMDRAMTYARTTRKQLDELTKRVQGINELEARIAKLEKQVASLSKETSSSKRSPARKAPPTASP